MTENLLPDRLTPITPTALYAALKRAWPTAIGGDLQRCSLLVLLAQVGHETGWTACHCWNLGNVKHVAGDGHDYCQFEAYEIVNGQRVVADMQFRAFASLDAGAADYLAILHKRFASAWPAVLAGDPAAFAHQLKLAHYYTDDEALYARGLLGIFQQLSRTIPPDPPDPAPAAHAAIGVASVEINESVHDAPPEASS